MRTLMGYRTGIVVMAELSSRRPTSSFSLCWGGREGGGLGGELGPGSRGGPGGGGRVGPLGGGSPIYVGVQLYQVTPGAVL